MYFLRIKKIRRIGCFALSFGKRVRLSKYNRSIVNHSHFTLK